MKAANDNLISKTTALEAQLKAANDNHTKDVDELRKELRDLKAGVGLPTVGGAIGAGRHLR